MIRIIVRTVNSNHVIHAGAPAPELRFKTFDVELPDLELHLKGASPDSYEYREVIGIEVLSGGEAQS